MSQAAVVSQDIRDQSMPRPNGMSELELLRTITGGFASFGSAVRLAALTDAQKSRVLAHLAEASTAMMQATNAYLFELGQARKQEAAASKAPSDVEATRAGAVGTQAVAAALLVAG